MPPAKGVSRSRTSLSAMETAKALRNRATTVTVFLGANRPKLAYRTASHSMTAPHERQRHRVGILLDHLRLRRAYPNRRRQCLCTQPVLTFVARPQSQNLVLHVVEHPGSRRTVNVAPAVRFGREQVLEFQFGISLKGVADRIGLRPVAAQQRVELGNVSGEGGNSSVSRLERVSGIADQKSDHHCRHGSDDRHGHRDRRFRFGAQVMRSQAFADRQA